MKEERIMTHMDDNGVLHVDHFYYGTPNEETSNRSNKSLKTLLFHHNKNLFVYLYGLENNKLLAYGSMCYKNEIKGNDYEFEIVPTDRILPVTFDEAIVLAQKNIDSSIYVNIDKMIKIVIIPALE